MLLACGCTNRVQSRFASDFSCYGRVTVDETESGRCQASGCQRNATYDCSSGECEQLTVPQAYRSPPTGITPSWSAGTMPSGSLGSAVAVSKTELLTNRHVLTTAPISPGSSGGGLFDARGNLVGMTTLVLAGRQRLNQALNFAIPADSFFTP